MTGFKMGIDGKAYISSDHHQDLPAALTYVEMDLIEQIEQELSLAEGAVDNRRTRYTKYGPGQLALAYTITMTYSSSDTTFDLIYTAMLAGTVMGLAVMDDSITTSGTKGWLLDANIFGGPKGETLNEFDSVPFVFKPSAYSTYNPTRHTVA